MDKEVSVIYIIYYLNVLAWLFPIVRQRRGYYFFLFLFIGSGELIYAILLQFHGFRGTVFPYILSLFLTIIFYNVKSKNLRIILFSAAVLFTAAVELFLDYYSARWFVVAGTIGVFSTMLNLALRDVLSRGKIKLFNLMIVAYFLSVFVKLAVAYLEIHLEGPYIMLMNVYGLIFAVYFSISTPETCRQFNVLGNLKKDNEEKPEDNLVI